MRPTGLRLSVVPSSGVALVGPVVTDVLDVAGLEADDGQTVGGQAVAVLGIEGDAGVSEGADLVVDVPGNEPVEGRLPLLE